jgi:hypothetical protein
MPIQIRVAERAEAARVVPYADLVRFYGHIGFAEIETVAAPAFLAERMADYRRSGLNAILMRRPSYFLAGARPSVSSM